MDDLDAPADPARQPAAAPGDIAGKPASEEPAPQESESLEPPPKKRRSFVRELPFLVGVAIVLALLLRLFLVQTFYIPSSSMENTLAIGDRVLVNKAVYELRDIKRGEVIVFSGDDSFNGADGASGRSRDGSAVAEAAGDVAGALGAGGERDYIKRVIGLPGDSVACCDAQGRLTVNGVPLDESDYLFPGDRPSLSSFDIVVPEGRLWVMGDHRSVSQDSRSHIGEPGGGTVPIDKVVGKAFVVIWPISHWRTLDIPDAFKQPEIDANAGR
jgi:signal peptidase I